MNIELMLTYKSLRQTFVFLIFGVFPPFADIFLGSSSMALGVFLSFILFSFLRVSRLKDMLFLHKAIFFWLIFSFFYFSLQHIFIGFWGFKSYLSVLMLSLLSIFSCFFSKEILYRDAFSVKCLFLLFWMLIFIAFIAILTEFNMGRFFYGKNKAVFPFGEPSHFSLFLGPFFFMAIVLTKKTIVKFFYILIISVIAIFLPSATLLIYVILATVILMRFSKSSFFVFIPIFLLGIYIMLNNSYFLTRIILSNDSKNLTALVYLQGIQDAYYSMKLTHGIGLGFQMLGTQPISPAGVQISYLMGGGELNRKDGGFLAAKIVAELGVYGIVILTFYLLIFFKSFIGLSKVARSPCDFNLAYIFSLSFIYASFVEFFVRGVGYFSPTIFF